MYEQIKLDASDWSYSTLDSRIAMGTNNTEGHNGQ